MSVAYYDISTTTTTKKNEERETTTIRKSNWHLLGISQPFNPLPDDQILDWSKLKQVADDILKSI